MVRVCEVIKTLDVGGAEVLLTERLSLAPKDDLSYTVVCLRARTRGLTDKLRNAGVPVVALSSARGSAPYLRLASTVRRLRPHVVNIHSPLPAGLLRPCLRLLPHRPRLVSTMHSVHLRRPTAVLNRLTIGLDDITVAVSPLVEGAPTTRGARHLVSRVHGVNLAEQRRWAQRAAATRAEFGVPDGAFAVVCIANFTWIKNHTLLVRAADRVVRQRPDTLFLLAGEGELRTAVAHDIARRGLGERVRILGHVANARRLAACADLVVLSSHHEALPVVIMEALAAGVPAVCTAVGGVPDLVRHGHNGILTEPESAEALAAGILEAMSPDTHRRLRAGAREDAAVVDMASTAVWFEGLYRELAAGRPRASRPLQPGNGADRCPPPSRA
ncbi:glycosyltransferase [Streptomyces sp. WMMC500]|uniref:glycosyltransferase n=1 Tax=Streptomyces sp. WMMC500 TaxID=3015154 RepID=UPI00248AC935|nr:glycosyltransferase [Streptomyces sp. WMMC500]WBB61974.1 glycosyltransferase [Streptomyces sp. WMMC500]